VVAPGCAFIPLAGKQATKTGHNRNRTLMPRLPASYPAIKPDILAVVRRVTSVLSKDGYKLVFPPDWQGVPHFHARIPGTETWAHVYIREETDERFRTRYNQDTRSTRPRKES
jgi:hypothetical protein